MRPERQFDRNPTNDTYSRVNITLLDCWMMAQEWSSSNRSSANIPIKQIAQNIWEVPQDFQPGMKVPARIYADEDLLAKMRTDRTIQQCVNVTHLTGIYKYAITMPDG